MASVAWMILSILMLAPSTAAAATPPAEQRVSPAADLISLHDAILADVSQFDPELMAHLKLGLPILRDDSLAVLRADAVRAAGFRRQVLAVDYAQLSETDQLTRDYLVRLLESIEARPERWLHSFPVTPYAGGWPHEAIRQLAAATPLSTPLQRQHYLAALQSYAAFVRSQRHKLAYQQAQGIRVPAPAIPGARLVVEKLQASANTFVPAADRLQALDEIERAAFQQAAHSIVEQELKPAFAALRAFLDERYALAAPKMAGLMHQPGGVQAYARNVGENTGTSLTPEQIHAIGVQMMTAANAELAQVWADLKFKGTRAEFARMIDADPRFSASTPDEVEAHFARAMKRIEPLLPRYFSQLPKAPYAVERAPPNIEQGMTFGYYRAPTPENPTGAYLYNGADPAGRSYANAAALIYHELLPGHHFQIALQQENQALPLLRRVNGFIPTTAFIEGWAEYAADLAGEMGLYSTPHERYGRIYARLFLANRLVVDTGLNALGWSLEDARAYMKANTFVSDAEITSELLRYSTDIPGQALAYAMGHREILRMRADAQASLGNGFKLPAFHTAVLGQGALPMDLLERRLGNWVGKQKSAVSAR